MSILIDLLISFWVVISLALFIFISGFLCYFIIKKPNLWRLSLLFFYLSLIIFLIIQYDKFKGGF